MHPRNLMFAAAAIVLASAPSSASAQNAPTRIGIMGGINLATFGGDDAEGSETKVGGVFGLTLVKPLSPAISLQVDGLFSMKGAEAAFEGGSAKFKANYLAIPLQLRYEIPTTGNVKPHLSGGVSFAYLASCNIEGTFEGETASVSCDLLEGDGIDGVGQINKFDMSAVVGGGLDFVKGSRTLTVGVRYSYGLTDLADNLALQNRVLSVYVGASMPWKNLIK